MASQIDLGAVVPIGKGDWNSSTTYERANIVRHNSTAWICKVATSTGVEPTESSSDWYLLVKDTSSVTSVNGMTGDVNINSILENPSTNDNSLKIASTSWVKTKVDNATNELNTQISQVDSKASTALQTANTANSKAEEALTKTGLPLGHIYLWPFSTPQDGSLHVNGGEYNRELYSDLWGLVQAKGWYKPDSEWQQIASENNGYCPWYSDGDGSTTFRTPKFAPYQKLALASGDAGKYIAEGLPNITGLYTKTMNYVGYDRGDYTGAFYEKSIGYKENLSAGQDSQPDTTSWGFDASKSNPIYGNSEHVTPESHEWIVCVVAFGTATNVGSVDVANTMSAIERLQSLALLKSGGTLTGAVSEKLLSLSGTSVTLDLTSANNFTHTITDNTTFTVSANSDTTFQLGTLVLTNAGNYTITWPSSFKWADNTPPTLNTSGIDVITFFTINGGTKYYAVQSITGVA